MLPRAHCPRYWSPSPTPPSLHQTGSASRTSSIAARKQQRKKRSSPSPDLRIEWSEDGDDDSERYMDAVSAAMPQAPPPGISSAQTRAPTPHPGEEDEYRVFAPKPSNVQSIQAGTWGWEEDVSPRPETPVADWNPQTGFTIREGSGTSTSTSAATAMPDVRTSLLTPSVPEGAHAADATPLPYVSKDQVMSSCLGASFWMTGLALFMRQYAQLNAPHLLGTDPRLLADLLHVPTGFESWQSLGLTVAATASVTVARLQLISDWPEFRLATHRSNKQILEPLGWLDIIVVAVLTGASEELLFRGAIIPASFLDWRGVLLSGVSFGLLHNSGGRNLAFAGWASAVGSLYGALFLITQNIWVPVTAHALANFCSAAVWKARNVKHDPV